jgi:hypothetical protein
MLADHHPEKPKPPMAVHGRRTSGDHLDEEVVAEISQPRESDEMENYYCVVKIPLFRKEEMRIFGVDAEQAHALSVRLVRDLLEPRGFDVIEPKPPKS